MARVAGVEIPNEKKLWVSLMSIYGIGKSLALKICKETNIKENLDRRHLEILKDLKILEVIEAFVIS